MVGGVEDDLEPIQLVHEPGPTRDHLDVVAEVGSSRVLEDEVRDAKDVHGADELERVGVAAGDEHDASATLPGSQRRQARYLRKSVLGVFGHDGLLGDPGWLDPSDFCHCATCLVRSTMPAWCNATRWRAQRGLP
jgi:hypothetical protein